MIPQGDHIARDKSNRLLNGGGGGGFPWWLVKLIVGGAIVFSIGDAFFGESPSSTPQHPAVEQDQSTNPPMRRRCGQIICPDRFST
jgi:hypothetical protein